MLGYSYEWSYYIPSNIRENTSDIEIAISYKRYFNGSFYTGVFIGANNIRLLNGYKSSSTIDYDKTIKIGLELGYTYFLNPLVGIEISGFFSRELIQFEREIIESYYYSRIGLKAGIIFLLKPKKHNQDD